MQPGATRCKFTGSDTTNKNEKFPIPGIPGTGTSNSAMSPIELFWTAKNWVMYDTQIKHLQNLKVIKKMWS